MLDNVSKISFKKANAQYFNLGANALDDDQIHFLEQLFSLYEASPEPPVYRLRRHMLLGNMALDLAHHATLRDDLNASAGFTYKAMGELLTARDIVPTNQPGAKRDIELRLLLVEAYQHMLEGNLHSNAHVVAEELGQLALIGTQPDQFQEGWQGLVSETLTAGVLLAPNVNQQHPLLFPLPSPQRASIKTQHNQPPTNVKSYRSDSWAIECDPQGFANGRITPIQVKQTAKPGRGGEYDLTKVCIINGDRDLGLTTPSRPAELAQGLFMSATMPERQLVITAQQQIHEKILQFQAQ